MTFKTRAFEIATIKGSTGAVRADLAELSYRHVSFLRRLHGLGVTLTEPSEESVRRYVELWLPLVAKMASTGLAIIPPTDIAWIWHCHRLSTKLYEAYTVEQFGTNATATTQLNGAASAFQFLTKETPRDLKQYSVDYWDMYNRGEPFFVEGPSNDAGVKNSSTATASMKTKMISLMQGWNGMDTSVVFSNSNDKRYNLFGFDLAACSKNQASFLWNISGPDFYLNNSTVLDQAFLVQCAQNYELFLELELQAGHLLVPTHAIDLMWHTHILSSTQRYHEDCMYLLGKHFHHDDTISTKELGEAFSKTCLLWKKVYGSNLENFGGLSRGNPPKEYYDPKWQSIATEDTRGTGSGSMAVNNTPHKSREPIHSKEEDGFSFLTTNVFCRVFFMVVVTVVGVVVCLLGSKALESTVFQGFAFFFVLGCFILLLKMYLPEAAWNRICNSNNNNNNGSCGGGGGCGGGGCGGC